MGHVEGNAPEKFCGRISAHCAFSLWMIPIKMYYNCPSPRPLARIPSFNWFQLDHTIRLNFFSGQRCLLSCASLAILVSRTWSLVSAFEYTLIHWNGVFYFDIFMLSRWMLFDCNQTTSALMHFEISICPFRRLFKAQMLSLFLCSSRFVLQNL